MTSASSWIRRSPPRRAPRARLVCFAHAGGGASSFSGWTRALPDDVELVRAQLPGREDRVVRPACTTVSQMLPELSREIKGLEALPFALYGHSMGAIVAFEVTRELRRQGALLPAVLFVSGRRAPHLPLSHAPLDALDEPALLAYLREMGGVDERLLGRFTWSTAYLPTLRADLQVSDAYAYRPEPPLSVPIYVFRGYQDSRVSVHEAMGWSRHTCAGFVFRALSGRHFFDRDGHAALLRVISDRIGDLREMAVPLALGE